MNLRAIFQQKYFLIGVAGVAAGVQIFSFLRDPSFDVPSSDMWGLIIFPGMILMFAYMYFRVVGNSPRNAALSSGNFLAGVFLMAELVFRSYSMFSSIFFGPIN